MRKALVILFAASLIGSITLAVAGPAGAAGPLPPKCKTFSGTETWTPALPKLGDPKKVNSTVKLNATLTGCTGVAGIKSGKSSATTKIKQQNCTTTIQSSSKGSKSTGKIIWNNGKTSTTANTLTLKSKVGVSPAKFQLVSKYTAGVGVGHTTTSMISVTLNKDACTKKPLSSAKFHATSSTTK
jgi:hypothetical protein